LAPRRPTAARRRRTGRAALLVLLAGLTPALAACGGGGTAAPPSTRPATHPLAAVPAPAGLLGGGAPQADGQMWVLGGTSSSRTLQLLDLTDGKAALIVPESAAAAAVSQSPSGLLGVGLATATTGALEVRNGATGALQASVAVGAPVRAVAAGGDGTTFYVLDGTSSVASVALVNAAAGRAGVTLPVPADTIAVAIDPLGQNLYALERSGQVTQVAVGSGQVVARYAVGASPRRLAISSDGHTLYVLKGSGGVDDVSVVMTTTERQVAALPAPADCVGLELSLDGRQLYELVGTPSIGNIQVFAA